MPQNLLAYISGDFSEDRVRSLRALVERLAEQWSWSRAAPRFVDQFDDIPSSQPEDVPVRTVGLLLAVSSPDELPRSPASEPSRIVEALAAFSLTEGVDFELQLDDTYVGEIRRGVPDRLVVDGLIAKW